MLKHEGYGINVVMDSTNLALKKKTPQERNPTGKGGFGDRKHDISPGGWKKEMVFSYQYKRFLNMNEEDFQAWSKTPKSERTMVELGAYMRVREMLKSLPDAKEITDRIEGKALQQMEIKAEVYTIDSILD